MDRLFRLLVLRRSEEKGFVEIWIGRFFLYLADNQPAISLKLYFFIISLCVSPTIFSQEISLYKQFNGHYDYTSFGNTLNIEENGSGGPCFILTSSSADFQLHPGQKVIAAYLYWAGSGPGDFEVTFNQVPILAQRTFNYWYNSGGVEYIYFAAFADITSQFQISGNGNYVLADLDLTQVIPPYCSPPGSGTNFGGWAVTVVYEDDTLPLNQVNIFDGLEGVSRTNQTLNISLNNLMVMETTGAKIGFLAWEGDRDLAVNETLRINGNILSNLPLNPPNNVFNGTNSFTGSDVLYNMDIDYFSISNYIQSGDTSAEIQLTSGQDFVMINNIITVLNTELPDATISIDKVSGGENCGERELEVDYTVYNLNSTAPLPVSTPIAFYANEILVVQAVTEIEIPIDGQESGIINFIVPLSIESDFILKAVVDDVGDGTGIVLESNEENNEYEVSFHLLVNPEIKGLKNLETCEIIGVEYFDLTQATSEIDPTYNLSFHLTEDDAQNNRNAIVHPEKFQNTENPQTIYIRVSNPDCFLVDSFTITVIPCPLPDATIDFPEITACRGRELTVPFTVYNLEATAPLPAQVSIAFYWGDLLLGVSKTEKVIPIGKSEDGQVALNLPENLPDVFQLTAVVDDDGLGNGRLEELREDNNDFSREIPFKSIAPIQHLPNLMECNTGFRSAIFDLRKQDDLVRNESDDLIEYFTTWENAMENIDPIQNPTHYKNLSDPQTIYVRLETEVCFAIASFQLEIENCKPFIPQGFSPNGDGMNDFFEISHLLDIYPNFELNIYTRNGNLVHTAHNQDGFWDGKATRGLLFNGNIVPVGTYYYVLALNDPKYPDPFVGWVYVNY